MRVVQVPANYALIVPHSKAISIASFKEGQSKAQSGPAA